jgi:hypothetical protein
MKKQTIEQLRNRVWRLASKKRIDEATGVRYVENRFVNQHEPRVIWTMLDGPHSASFGVLLGLESQFADRRAAAKSSRQRYCLKCQSEEKQ